MNFGGPTSVQFGDPEEFLLDYMVTDQGGGVSVYILAASGYGNSWWAFVIGGRVVAVFYVTEGVAKLVYGSYDPSIADRTVSVYPLGDWDNTADIDVVVDQQSFESDKGKSLMVDWDAVMEVVPDAFGDAAQLSAWSLTGITRFATSRPGLLKTEAKIDVKLVNSGATRTVTLSLGGVTLASGSRNGNGVIVLSAQNNSGLSGSVTVAYTADITSGCVVVGRWAANYTVSAGGVTKVVADDGRGSRLSTRLSGLTPGNVTVLIMGNSDSGVAISTFSQLVNVPGRPLPPGTIAYVSGNWTNTVISIVSSGTGSATYELYDVEALDGPCKLSEPSLLKPAQVGTFNWALNSLASAGTGKRRIVVKAVNGGVEDGTRDGITIEYDAGNVVLPRPNVPSFKLSAIPVTGGRTINVDFTYDNSGEAVAATQIGLFVIAEGGAVPADGAAPDTTIALPTALNGMSRGKITKTVAGDGWNNVLVRAISAAGKQSNNATPTTDPAWASNVVMAAAGNVAIAVSV